MVQKVAYRSWIRARALPSDDWNTLSVNPAVNWYLFESGTVKAAEGEGWTPPTMPKIQCASNTHCPHGYYGCGNLYL